jgi:gluconokinase
MIILLMGVSGSGKTTVGEKLAERLGFEFRDADDFHPPENVAKMHGGVPLDDHDRAPWLENLRGLIETNLRERRGTILACSALKRKYRDFLRIDDAVRFVHLKGDYRLIEKRLEQRVGHFMNSALLQSQFDALEEPKNALTVEIDAEPNEIVEKIITRLNAEARTQ